MVLRQASFQKLENFWKLPAISCGLKKKVEGPVLKTAETLETKAEGISKL